MNKKLVLALLTVGISLGAVQAQAACSDISYSALSSAAENVKAASNTGGFGLNMWVTFVDETGKVCAVTTTGTKGALASQGEWLGSRVISAQKANTANAFSLNGVSISTGFLFVLVQPGGSLFGLQESNPVDAGRAYKGDPNNYGKINDPLVHGRVGGVNVFGGGIAVYKNGAKVGAIGVSGDTSCTDHAFAWKVRDALGLASGYPDFDAGGGFERLQLVGSATGLFQHPDCYNTSGITTQAEFGFK